MITVRCTECRSRLFKYRKVGKGKLLHCWKGRIVKDYTVKKGRNVYCTCGSLVGVDEGRWIKLKCSAVFYQGTREK